MAIVEIAHKPDMTQWDAETIFRSHFRAMVDVPGFFQRLLPRRHFAVRETEWIGVGIRLKQSKNSTAFVFTGLAPNTGVHSFLYSLAPPIAWLILRPGRKALEAQVKEFIENAVEFQ